MKPRSFSVHHVPHGFALAASLVLALLISALVAASFDEVLHSSALASSTSLSYQAAHAGEYGLQVGKHQLDAGLRPRSKQSFSPSRIRDGFDTTTTWMGRTTSKLPEGFSVGRFEERHEHLISEALGPRHARAMQGAGFKIVDYLAQPSPHTCVTVPEPIVVVLGNKNLPSKLLLKAREPYGMQLLDPTSLAVRWSLGPDSAATQQSAQLTASFGTSLTVVDVNSDGLHDRIYAGDSSGRLWRIDLHNNAAVSALASGKVLANLSSDRVVRPILAAPDVALVTPTRGAPWLNVAVGTAHGDGNGESMGFLMLRDRHPFDTLPQGHFDTTTAIHISELMPLSQHRALEPQADSANGFWLPLGALQVATQSITLDGRVILLATTQDATASAPCMHDSYVASIDARTGAAAIDSNNDGAIDSRDGITRVGAVPYSAALQLARSSTSPGTTAYECLVASRRIPNCSTDLQAKRSYWTRGDAD
jgi:hypothetical protein